jgi:hypothetical protein
MVEPFVTMREANVEGVTIGVTRGHAAHSSLLFFGPL